MTAHTLDHLDSPLLSQITTNAAGTYTGIAGDVTWAAEIRRLADARDAVILAHNYELPEIQDIADYTGDSLALSRVAANDRHSTIVFCGVHFMAETAKILSPEKRVLIPDARAGCSLASSITAEELAAWKTEYPNATVVSYVNTTAAVKAMTDICCTSSNAVDVVKSISADQEILFCPDQFLGAHVKRETGRDNIHIWMGECHIHAGINGDVLAETARQHPDSDLYIHPECGCTTSALYLAQEGVVPQDQVKILSTGGMLEEAEEADARGERGEVLVATEVGMLHQLNAAAPDITFTPINPPAACPFMKMITPAALLRCLALGEDEIELDPDTIAAAYRPVDRMISIGNSPAAR